MAGVFGLRGDLKVAASRIGEDALAAGLRVRATLADGTTRALRIAAIRRLGSVSIAAPGDVLTEGDEINAIVAPDALTQFAGAFASARPEVRLTA